MDRAVLIIGAVAIAGVVAWVIDRRRPDRPTAPVATVPRQLDRRDFVRPDASWLVAVFTADTCDTCAGVWGEARRHESPEVAVQELEVERDASVHRRYEIDAVPTLLIADIDGVVVRWFLGPVDADRLEATLADLPQP